MKTGLTPAFAHKLGRKTATLAAVRRHAIIDATMQSLYEACGGRPRKTFAEVTARFIATLTDRERAILAQRFPERPAVPMSPMPQLAGWPIDKPVPESPKMIAGLPSGHLTGAVFACLALPVLMSLFRNRSSK